jgi:hypothetical protein
MADTVPEVKLRAEFTATHPPRLIGFGVFEGDTLVGVMTEKTIRNVMEYVYMKQTELHYESFGHFKSMQD